MKILIMNQFRETFISISICEEVLNQLKIKFLYSK